MYRSDIEQEAVIKTIAKKKKCKKAKWLSEEVLQIAEKRKDPKGKGEKERYTIRMQRSKEEQREITNLPQRSMQRNRGKQ